MECLQSLLGRIHKTGSVSREEDDIKIFFSSLAKKDSNKDMVVMIDAHGGGKEFTLGEQYTIPVLTYTDTGKYVRAENYPRNWQVNPKVWVAHPDFSAGNEIAAQDVVDGFDNQESSVAGIIFLSCNEEGADLKAAHVSLAYVKGFAGISESYKGSNTLKVIV